METQPITQEQPEILSVENNSQTTQIFSEEKLHRIQCGKIVKNKTQFKQKYLKEYNITKKLKELDEFSDLCEWVKIRPSGYWSNKENRRNAALECATWCSE